jgi:hypothetical protein
MENNLERISAVKSEKLSAELYFQSLLEEAYSLCLLSDGDIERIQYECLELLANKTERYNGMDSSSIRVEVAQNIMTSNLFTIGLWLKTYPCPDDAVTALKETNISELYQKGRERIDTMVKTAKTIHAKILQNVVDTKNYFYNATVIDAIKGFFKLYYPDFGAQEIHITADYPVFNPMGKLVGIEFIQRYLQAIYYENAFCLNFMPEDIHHLLCGYDEGYQELLFNIYEPILAAAIGCVLAGENVHRLDMSENAISFIPEVEKTIKTLTYSLNEQQSELKNRNNLFIDKYFKYNYVTKVCGMSEDWCKDSIAEFSFEPVRVNKKSITSPLAAEALQDREYTLIFSQGKCTFGDMDINRHRDTFYINDFPCGTKCPHCGTFWID